MDKVLSLATFPSPTKTHAVLALGPRWLAYASDEPLPRSAEPESTALDRVVESASSAATDVAHTLLGFGKKTLNAYWWGESDVSDGAAGGAAAADVPSTTAEQDARAGSVKLFDVVRLRSIAHFRAHWNALAALEFDSGGTLLVTAAVDGQTFNVYSLRPPVLATASSTVVSSTAGGGSGLSASTVVASSAGGVGAAGAGAASSTPMAGDVELLVPRQLYRLVRGFTSAAIQSITFSGDSRYLSVASMRGTTHIYALSPNGGEVTLLSHAPATAHAGGLIDKTDRDDWYRPASTLVTLRALSRIKSFTNVATTIGGEVLRVPAIASTSLFADAAAGLARGAKGARCVYAVPRHGSDARQMFVVTQMGVMTRYQLLPHAPTAPADRAATPNALCVDAVPLGAWDLCRRVRWEEVRFSLRDELALHPASENPELAASSRANVDVAERASRWLANVEIETHTPTLRPLFIGPQCRVRTFVMSPNVAQLREAALERAAALKEANASNDDDMLPRYKSPMKKKKKNRKKGAPGGTSVTANVTSSTTSAGTSGSAATTTTAAAAAAVAEPEVVREGRSLQRHSSTRQVFVEQDIGVLVHVDERTQSQLVTTRRTGAGPSVASAASTPLVGMMPAGDAIGDLEPVGSAMVGQLNDYVFRGDYEPLVDLPSPQPPRGAVQAAGSTIPSAPPLSSPASAPPSASATASVLGAAPQRARLPGHTMVSNDNEEDDALADRIAVLVREAMATPLRFAAQLSAPHLAPQAGRAVAVVSAAAATTKIGVGVAPTAAAAAVASRPKKASSVAGKKLDGSLSQSSSDDEEEVGVGVLSPIDLFDAASYQPRSFKSPPVAPVGISPRESPRSNTSPPKKALPTPPVAQATPVFRLAAAPMRLSGEPDVGSGPTHAASAAATSAAASSAATTTAQPLSNRVRTYAQALLRSPAPAAAPAPAPVPAATPALANEVVPRKPTREVSARPKNDASDATRSSDEASDEM